MTPMFGILGAASIGVKVAAIAVSLLILGYTGARLWIWTLVAFAFLWGLGAPGWVWWLFGVPAAILNIPLLRRRLVSFPIMRALTSMRVLPTISETERIALEAGTTWLDEKFFSGKPDFKAILEEPYPELTEEERAFLDGPVEAVCRMTSDWEVSRLHDLPEEVWKYLKRERFFGMVIPKAYGGHGFSATGMNAIVAKLASRSNTLAIDVMVPNSLGPAELLIHYGTDSQKKYYLPRLATGEEMPCFALTEPNAGSDAAGIVSSGEVFRGEKGELLMRLNWDKRYITLASVSTVLGLAFKLKDPNQLLGRNEDLGITCALIPSDTPGVAIDRRHDPLGVSFINSPTEGRDVVVSVDQIIGGPDQAGNGWKMLMETLAGGRGVFLPAQSTGGSKLAARVASAYALVRQQFGHPIGRFEGVEELLARIAGLTYLQDALSPFTCGALDKGKKPAVISAIAKYHATELNRLILNDAMDLLGGAGISMGPKNLIGQAFLATPIGITVEGSNIVTRSLIIFGQGLIRCHPFVIKEMRALEKNDRRAFDLAFWGHCRATTRNLFRAVLLNITRGYLAGAPVGGPTSKYYRKLSWASAAFAVAADFALITLGGSLKQKEKLSGRFADVLSWLYLGTAALRKYEASENKKGALPFVQWVLEYALERIQRSFEGILAHFPSPLLGPVFRGPVAVWARTNPFGKGPSDALGHRIAAAMQKPGGMRDALTEGIYVPSDPDEPLAGLEKAFRLAHESESIFSKVRSAIKSKRLPKGRPKGMVDEALRAGVITQEEYEILKEAELARNEAIRVDAFASDAFASQVPTPPLSPSPRVASD